MASLTEIRKKYGDDIMLKPGTIKKKEFLTSSSIGLDKALGGGYVVGRVVEIFGNESSGKSTLCFHAVAEAQKKGVGCAYIDMENALDYEYVENIGVDLGKLEVQVPTHGEQASDLVRDLITSDEIGLIIVDSVATMLPIAEVQGETGDAHMGRHAKLMSQMCRMINPIAAKHGVTVIFINQLRMKIGAYGNPEVTTGGRALPFYATQRLKVHRAESQSGQVKEDGEMVATPVTVTVIKNKVAKPFQKAEFMIRYGEGIDKVAELVDIGIDSGYITGRYKINGESVAKDKEGLLMYMRENFEQHKELLMNSIHE